MPYFSHANVVTVMAGEASNKKSVPDQGRLQNRYGKEG